MHTEIGSGVNDQMLGGRFVLRRVLGRGGMAQVYDGWDTRLHRSVAIKVMHPALSASPENRERFRTEARAAACLNHPNIVAVHDFGDDNGMPFIVMERLPGTTLGDEIAQGLLPETRVRAVLDDVLAALGAAHATGILHRDIKPGNILTAASGDVMKVADFGIAKTPGVACTLTGQIVGTMAYVSPERLAGAPASLADDIYAVGVVGYECLTGHRPFQQHDDDMAALASAILHREPLPLAAVRPDVSGDLIAAIERAMAHDRRQRFASVAEMRAALNVERPVPIGPKPVVAAVPPATQVLEAASDAPIYVPAPKPRRPALAAGRKRLAGVAAIAAVLAVSGSALALGSPSPEAPKPASNNVQITPSAVRPPVPPPPPPSEPSGIQQVVQHELEIAGPGDVGKNGGHGKKVGHGKKGGPRH